MKNDKREEARELRAIGLSIPKIAKRIDCSQSSVSVWVRDIVLTANQTSALKIRGRENLHKGHALFREKAKANKERAFEIGKTLIKTDPLFRVICALYWGEGNKMNNRNSFTISNADTVLLKLIVKWLKEEDQYENIKLRIHYHEENLKEGLLTCQTIKEYWLKALGLEEKHISGTGLTKSSNNRFTKNKRVGYQLFGTAYLSVHRTDLLNKVFGGIEGLKLEA